MDEMSLEVCNCVRYSCSCMQIDEMFLFLITNGNLIFLFFTRE